MASMKQVIEEIIAEFKAFENVDEIYIHLFQQGADLPEMDESLKTKENLVRGCQSTLWFHVTREGDRYYLQADSDSMVVKGIAALLVRITAGQTAEEIQKLNLDFLDRLNIWKLPSERNNGLIAMLEAVKDRVSCCERR
jgi:cysteine desulfuration protein SufE